MKPAIHVNDIQPEHAHFMPEPFASRLGPYEGISLGDHFGLTQWGVPNAHHLVNPSDRTVKILVIGSRVEGEEVHYPDDDFQWIFDEEGV